MKKIIEFCPTCQQHRARVDELVKASAHLDGDEGKAREWMRQFDREAKAFRKHREECENDKNIS